MVSQVAEGSGGKNLDSIEQANSHPPAQSFSSHRHQRIRVIFWVVAVALGLLQAWASSRYRPHVGGDGVSYLDIGDAYLRGDWSTAINGYWSPLYSWLLGSVMLVVGPSPYWEYPLVCLVNFAVYLCSLACFDFLLRGLIRYHHQAQVSGEAGSGRMVLPGWAWLVLGYTLFLWASLELLLLRRVTPDMCVAAFVYLAAGVTLRIRMGRDSWLSFVALGAILGFGYLAKAAMFPIAFIFLGTNLFLVRDYRRAAPRVLIALIVFLAIASPFIVALSKSKGRLTWGDTGKLNYSWFVNESQPNYAFSTARNIHWQGEVPGTGTPRHPTRKIFDAPAIYEFGAPITATYPPWYDPSYWYEGVVNHFTLGKQVRAIWRQLKTYYSIIIGLNGSLIIGLVLLMYMSARRWLIAKDIVKNGFLLVPAMAALGMYSLVWVEPRHVAPFITLLFLGLFSSVNLPASQESSRLLACVVVVILLMFCVSTGASTLQQAGFAVRDLAKGKSGRSDLYWQVADGLKQMGVEPGDQVATIGTSMFVYWARMARVRVVAEIPIDEKDQFWAADNAVKAQVIETFRRTGAKVIIADQVPVLASTDGWQRIGRTSFYAYLLPR